MKKGISTVNCATICSPLENVGLKIINLHHEYNAYLLKLAWNFAYNNRSWSLLINLHHENNAYLLLISGMINDVLLLL